MFLSNAVENTIVNFNSEHMKKKNTYTITKPIVIHNMTSSFLNNEKLIPAEDTKYI